MLALPPGMHIPPHASQVYNRDPHASGDMPVINGLSKHAREREERRVRSAQARPFLVSSFCSFFFKREFMQNKDRKCLCFEGVHL
jgi:hypothetical protein